MSNGRPYRCGQTKRVFSTDNECCRQHSSLEADLFVPHDPVVALLPASFRLYELKNKASLDVPLPAPSAPLQGHEDAEFF